MITIIYLLIEYVKRGLNVNFDYWKKLYEEDPDKFEQERKAIIDETISAAPKNRQHRLKQLQWRIDMERKRCKTPLKSLIKIDDMMMESFFKLNDALKPFRE